MGDTIKRTGIKIQGIICIILAFFGGVNIAVLMWMAKKMNKKGLRWLGITSLLGIFMSVILVSLVNNETIITIIVAFLIVLTVIPIPIILISAKDFASCLTLEMLLKKNSIIVEKLSEDAFSESRVFPDERTKKNAQRLYGNKWEGVLRAIQYKENELRKKKENEEKEKIARKKEEEVKNAEMKRAAELEKVKAETLKMQAEAEARKIERMKEEAERVKAEALKMQAEAEVRKAEAEQAKAEQAKAEAEAQKLQVEADMKKMERHKEKNSTEYNLKKAEGSIQKVDINLCTEQELSLIQGIGIILAKKAIRIRNEKGQFQSVDEFMQEVGIRENNKVLVAKYLVCETKEKMAENNARKHGRKIDL